MKSWTFNTCAISGFSASALAVVFLIVNALTRSASISVLLPLAIVSLVVGGVFSARAHLLWIRGRSAR